MLKQAERNLTYLLAKKSNVVVISLIGHGAPRDQDILEQCQEELVQLHNLESINIFIFNLRDLEDLNDAVFRNMVQMQLTLRNMKCFLRFCGVNPKLKLKLVNNGIIKAKEITNNIVEAVASIE